MSNIIIEIIEALQENAKERIAEAYNRGVEETRQTFLTILEQTPDEQEIADAIDKAYAEGYSDGYAVAKQQWTERRETLLDDEGESW